MGGQFGYYAGNKTIPEIANEVIRDLKISPTTKSFKKSEIQEYITKNYNRGEMLMPEVFGYIRYTLGYPISIVSSDQTISKSLYKIASTLKTSIHTESQDPFNIPVELITKIQREIEKFFGIGPQKWAIHQNEIDPQKPGNQRFDSRSMDLPIPKFEESFPTIYITSSLSIKDFSEAQLGINISWGGIAEGGSRRVDLAYRNFVTRDGEEIREIEEAEENLENWAQQLEINAEDKIKAKKLMSRILNGENPHPIYDALIKLFRPYFIYPNIGFIAAEAILYDFLASALETELNNLLQHEIKNYPDDILKYEIEELFNNPNVEHYRSNPSGLFIRIHLAPKNSS